MKIVNEWPPNIEKIRAAISIPEDAKVHFCYGDTIYNPSGIEIAPDYIHHEEVHEKQQEKIGKDIWWDRFCSDPMFRVKQEAEAYGRQLKYLRKRRVHEIYVAQSLSHFAQALSSPLYGSAISQGEAIRLINKISRQ